MLNGYKTWLAGIGGLLMGLGMLVKDVVAVPFSLSALQHDGGVLLGSLAVLGIGGKLQKLLEALKK